MKRKFNLQSTLDRFVKIFLYLAYFDSLLSFSRFHLKSLIRQVSWIIDFFIKTSLVSHKTGSKSHDTDAHTHTHTPTGSTIQSRETAKRCSITRCFIFCIRQTRGRGGQSGKASPESQSIKSKCKRLHSQAYLRRSCNIWCCCCCSIEWIQQTSGRPTENGL